VKEKNASKKKKKIRMTFWWEVDPRQTQKEKWVKEKAGLRRKVSQEVFLLYSEFLSGKCSLREKMVWDREITIKSASLLAMENGRGCWGDRKLRADSLDSTCPRCIGGVEKKGIRNRKRDRIRPRIKRPFIH